MPHYLGLDIGGTNIKFGLVDDTARVLAKHSVPTHADAGPAAVTELLTAGARQTVADAGLALADVAAIGIGCPGPIDFEHGSIMAAPNMKGWVNAPLRKLVADATGRPAVLENDANAAAFGEFWAGAGRDRGVRDLVMLTLGTGIGSGIVIEGNVFHGAFGLGAEAGHMVVVAGGTPCGCGQHGCLEMYASASSVARRAQQALAAGTASSLSSLAGPPGRPVESRDVFDHARAGDGLAAKIVDETCLYLGVACVNISRILDPQMIVFAGGMILAGDFLFDRIRKVFAAQTWKVAPSNASIVPAELGNDAGFIGAAAVAWDAHRRGRLSG